MSFTVREYRDLLKLLAEHPEWREELRRALLSDDFLALPQIVRELAEAQKRTEQRLLRLETTVAELVEAQKLTEKRVNELAEAQKRTEQRVEELAEAQKRTEERLLRLETTVAELIEAQKLTEKRVNELAEAQKRTEQRVEELAEAQKRTEQRVEELAEAQKRTEETLAALIRRVDDIDRRLTKVEQRLEKVDGRTLEIEYERKAMGYFGQVLRRPQVINLGELEDRVSPYLSKEELQDLWRLDLLLQGYLRKPLNGEEKPEAYLAIEVSVLVDREDVERAKRRAGLLRKARLLALPVAAGEDLTERSAQLAEKEGVILVSDGSMRFIDQAIQQIIQE